MEIIIELRIGVREERSILFEQYNYFEFDGYKKMLSKFPEYYEEMHNIAAKIKK